MTTLGMETSPFDSSPFVSKSPRLYWQSRDPASPSRLNVENRSPTDQRDGSPSPSKRSSIENLKRASRVKNSNMFAREHRQEYDPSSSPNIERPLATGRPLSKQESEKVYGSRGINRLEKGAMLESSKIPIYSPPKSPPKFCEVLEISQTPSKAQSSPSKSSLSSKTRYAQIPILDPENGTWSEDENSIADRELPPGKSLHRHAKSVTFDAAPPQINEYEMTTPDPSSVASGSREGSYESAGNEEEDSFDRGSSIERDDSFDESLEDTEKTPVVLPEDWRFMSPATANDDLAAQIENPFNGSESSPAPTARASSAIDARTSLSRTDSANSNGERRPLPPLPAFGMPEFLRERSNSAGSLSASAERMSLGYDKKEPNSGIQIYEDQVANDDVAGLDEFQKPPRISRESILRKVKSQRQLINEDDYDFSSPTPDPLTEKDRIDQLHPDIPIPSLEVEPQVDYTEVDRIIKQEEDEESEIDVYSIPDLYSQHLHVEAYMDSMEDNQAFEDAPSHISRNQDEDDESHYSEDFEVERSLSKSPKDDEGPPTPKVNQSTDTGVRTEIGNGRRTSLPQFSSMLEEQDFGLGLNSFMTPPPALNEDPVKATSPSPNTPDSVIRHAIASSPLPESPSVPEPIATIKAPGTNLKTRPSITPADIRAMAETRRQVSGETPLVPTIPEKYQSRSSVVTEPEAFPIEHETFIKFDEGMSDFETSKLAKRKSSLVQLEIPVDRSDDELGFGLNKEFDRVMEAQKVAFKSLAPEPGLQSSSHGCAEYMAGQHFIPVTQNFADKRIRTQKGYLMRQNTKVVVASSASQEDAVDPIDANGTALRGTRSAGNSPRKSAHAQPWTTEPWNGKMRRKSLRQSGGSPQKKVFQGVAPPLPGQQSNVAGVLGSVTEDSVISGIEELEEGGEKGVLFVKVVRVKDLDLPLPKGMAELAFNWTILT